MTGMVMRHIVFALLIVCAGCSERTADTNVILVTLDTTRKDSFQSALESRSGGVALGGLVEGAARFENAYAAAPVTRPSHAAIFTGLYPSGNGVTNNHCLLPGDLPDLAEVFRDEGYRTIGVVASSLFHDRSGFLRGFDRTNRELSLARGPQPLMNFYYQDAGTVVDLALDGIREAVRDGRPYFAWLHFYDPHFPYSPPARYAREFQGHRAVEKAVLRALTSETGGDVTREMYGWIRAQYDREVWWTLRELDRFFRELGALQPGESPLVILTADHGESFEHGLFFRHRPSVYNTVLAVPLVISWPGRVPPAAIEENVSLVDLFPTLLDLLGIDAPPGLNGSSLAPLLKGGGAPVAPVLFTSPTFPGEEQQEIVRKHDAEKVAARDDFETVLGIRRVDLAPHRDRYGIIEGGWKLIVDEGRPAELYRIADDPDERVNRLSAEPAVAESLFERYRAARDAMAVRPGSATLSESDDDRKALRAHGYLD